MDLGADTWQTFRYVTFPQLRTALLAGALLAFALSFDEVVVTIFTSGAQQTLPIWIYTNFARPRELPIVNVVALFVIVAVDHPGLDRPANRRRTGSDGRPARARWRRDRDAGLARTLSPTPIGHETPVPPRPQ